MKPPTSAQQSLTLAAVLATITDAGHDLDAAARRQVLTALYDDDHEHRALAFLTVLEALDVIPAGDES